MQVCFLGLNPPPPHTHTYFVYLSSEMVVLIVFLLISLVCDLLRLNLRQRKGYFALQNSFWIVLKLEIHNLHLPNLCVTWISFQSKLFRILQSGWKIKLEGAIYYMPLSPKLLLTAEIQVTPAPSDGCPAATFRAFPGKERPLLLHTSGLAKFLNWLNF